MTIEYRTINTRYINTISINHTDHKNNGHTDMNRYPNIHGAIDHRPCRMRALFDICR